MTSIDDIMMTASPLKNGQTPSAKAMPGLDDDQGFERAVSDLGKRPGHGKAVGKATPHAESKDDALGAKGDAQGQAGREWMPETEIETKTSDGGDPLSSPSTGQAKLTAGTGQLGAQLRLSDALRRAGQPAKTMAEVLGKDTGADAQAEIDPSAAATEKSGAIDRHSRMHARIEEKLPNALSTAPSDEPMAAETAQPFTDRTQRGLKAATPIENSEIASDLGLPTAAPGTQAAPGSDTRQLFALLGVPSPAARGQSQVKGSEDRAAAGETTGELALPAGIRKQQGAATSEAARANKAAAAKDADPGAPADRIFRFASADGKASPMAVASGSDGAKIGAAHESASAGRAETVTVLEARRYLGLAPSINTQAVTSAIAGSPELAQSLKAGADPLQSGAGRVMNTLRIQMHPIDLGTVTATLRLKDDALQVELKVETGEAYRQLSDDQDAMIRALRDQGFAVDQITFVLSPTASGDPSQASGQGQNQSASNQPGRDPQNPFSSSGEGRQNESSRNRQPGQDARPDMGGDRNRTGGQSGVYI